MLGGTIIQNPAAAPATSLEVISVNETSESASTLLYVTTSVCNLHLHRDSTLTYLLQGFRKCECWRAAIMSHHGSRPARAAAVMAVWAYYRVTEKKGRP